MDKQNETSEPSGTIALGQDNFNLSRRCPACAEIINAMARKCRYCGEAVEPVVADPSAIIVERQNPPDTPSPSPASEPPVVHRGNQKKPFDLVQIVGVALAIVLVLFIIVVASSGHDTGAPVDEAADRAKSDFLSKVNADGAYVLGEHSDAQGNCTGDIWVFHKEGETLSAKWLNGPDTNRLRSYPFTYDGKVLALQEGEVIEIGSDANAHPVAGSKLPALEMSLVPAAAGGDNWVLNNKPVHKCKLSSDDASAPGEVTAEDMRQAVDQANNDPAADQQMKDAERAAASAEQEAKGAADAAAAAEKAANDAASAAKAAGN